MFGRFAMHWCMVVGIVHAATAAAAGVDDLAGGGNNTHLVVVQTGYSYSGPIAMQPLRGNVTMAAATSLWPPPGVTLGALAFDSCVFDGSRIWFIPRDASHFVIFDPNDVGGLALLPTPATAASGSFIGGVFDGTALWILPFEARYALKITMPSPSVQSVPLPSSTPLHGATLGGTFDGAQVWLAPFNGPSIIFINTTTATVSTAFCPYTSSVDTHFAGAVFDGDLVWFVPYRAPAVLAMPAATNINGALNVSTVRVVDAWPMSIDAATKAKFLGATFDGARVWFAPYMVPYLLAIDVTTFAMQAFDLNALLPSSAKYSTLAFSTALFDGARLWLGPYTARCLVSVGVGIATGAAANDDTAVTSFCDWPAGTRSVPTQTSWGSMCTDGRRLWFPPLLGTSSTAAPTIPMLAFTVASGESLPTLACNRSLAAPPHVINQDGTGSSAAVRPRPLLTNVSIGGATMSDWPPAGLRFGFQAGYFQSTRQFGSIVFDGAYLWLMPFQASHAVRYDPATAASVLVAIPSPYVAGLAFTGAAFDGRYIWGAPYNAGYLLQLDSTNTSWSRAVNFTVAIPAEAAFTGIAFDGASAVWLSPAQPNNADASYNSIVRVNTSNAADSIRFAPLTTEQVNIVSGGPVFDGRVMWFVPFDVAFVAYVDTRLPLATPQQQAAAIGKITQWPSTITGTTASKYEGGTFDGSRVWFAPFTTVPVAYVDVATKVITALWYKGPSSAGGLRKAIFDGARVWLLPERATAFVAIDTRAERLGIVTLYPAAASFTGACSDGRRIWLAPSLPNATIGVIEAAESDACLGGMSASATPSATRTSTRTATRQRVSPSATSSDTQSQQHPTSRRGTRHERWSRSQTMSATVGRSRAVKHLHRVSTATQSPSVLAPTTAPRNASVPGVGNGRLHVDALTPASVTVAAPVASAVMSLMLPSAASRPARLQAVTDLPLCHYTVNELDFVRYPFQTSYSAMSSPSDASALSSQVGSVLLNGVLVALLSVGAIAASIVMRPTRV